MEKDTLYTATQKDPYIVVKALTEEDAKNIIKAQLELLKVLFGEQDVLSKQ